MLLSLDFLALQPSLQIRTGEEGAKQVFDPVRRKWVALAPEELVRQLTLLYLIQVKGYAPRRIRVEIGIKVNGMMRRCDIVVFDREVRPWLLVECKSPKIPLQQSAMEQAARYNLTLGVPFLCVTNGLHTACCALDHANGSFQFLEDFPEATV